MVQIKHLNHVYNNAGEFVSNFPEDYLIDRYKGYDPAYADVQLQEEFFDIEDTDGMEREILKNLESLAVKLVESGYWIKELTMLFREDYRINILEFDDSDFYYAKVHYLHNMFKRTNNSKDYDPVLHESLDCSDNAAAFSWITDSVLVIYQSF